MVRRVSLLQFASVFGIFITLSTSGTEPSELEVAKEPSADQRIQKLERENHDLRYLLKAHQYLDPFQNRQTGHFVPMVNWTKISPEGDLLSNQAPPTEPKKIALPPGWNQLVIDGRIFLMFPVDQTLPAYDEKSGKYDWNPRKSPLTATGTNERDSQTSTVPSLAAGATEQ